VDGSTGLYVVIGITLYALSSIGGLALVGFLLLRLPENYFCDPSCREFWIDRHPVIRRIGSIVKNLLGGVLVALGLVLSLPGIPGPGIITILVGVMLLDFPGKRRLERWLIGRPAVLGKINRLRLRYGKGPFAWPEEG
jgi:hypothetical protein